MRQVRASPEGAAGRRARACVVPSTSPSCDGERGRFRPARGERGAQRLEHAAEEEGQRLEAVHGPVELERRLEPLGERRGDEDAVVLAAGEPGEAGALGPEARGEGHGGQPREVADRAQAPAPEEREPLRPDVEELEGQRGESGAFPSRGHDGETGTRPGEDERRRAGEREGGLRLDRARGGRVEERPAELLRGRPQPAEAGEVEEDGRRRGSLDARRERARDGREGALLGEGSGGVEPAEHLSRPA